MSLANDNPLFLPNVNELSDDELYTLLEGIRERRLKPVQDYHDGQALKAKAKAVKMEEQLDKQLVMFAKELASVDKVLAKLEGRSRKIRAIRMEVELLT
jgi:hypothetical protein